MYKLERKPYNIGVKKDFVIIYFYYQDYRVRDTDGQLILNCVSKTIIKEQSKDGR